jgi:uncharacterized protein YraI
MTKQLSRLLVALVALLVFLSVGVLVASSADSDGYLAQYYNNRNLQGNPVLTRYDSVIDFNWGEGSPAPNVVNPDDFSVRWQRTVQLQPGVYRFTASTDNGVRVMINNRQIINQWWDHALRTYSADVYVPGGDTYIVVEYYERNQTAIASFKYQLIQAGVQTATPKPWNPTATPKPWNPTATPKPWNPTATPVPYVPPGSGPELAACTSQPLYANYWNNKFLSGPPALTRTESNINYNWGDGKPAGNIQNDNFSARWSTTYNLLAGTYTFTTTADDGVRVYVNGQRLIDQWYNSAAKTGRANYYHSGGKVDVVVEYYEAAEFATIAFSCSRISSDTQPRPTATPVWKPTATRIPPTAVPPTAVPPTATPDPLLTANAGTCQISRVYNLNVRSGPGLSYAIVGTVEYGDIVIRTGGRSGTWVQIRTDQQKIGWVKEYYCGNGEAPSSGSAVTTCGTVTATVDALYVRSGPGSGYSWLDVAYRGEGLTLTCLCEGQWISIMTAEGLRGWVYYPYTNITQAQLNTLH